MKCKAILENKKDCGKSVMLEPDFLVPSTRFYRKNDISTITFLLKPAKHGMCFYHFNMARSKEIMDRKMRERLATN
jgi:hypothetical protein